MKNKYDNIVEQINKQKSFVEQKDNLTEQLTQAIANVNTARDAAIDLLKDANAAKDAANSCNAAARNTDNSVDAITHAILYARKVVVKYQPDVETFKQP